MPKVNKNIFYPFSIYRAMVVANLLKEHLIPKSAVLDVGCGNMLIARNLKKMTGVKIWGIDVINMNLTSLPHKIFNDEKIPYRNNQFHTVLLLSVLHHINKQNRLFREAVRVARERIIIHEDIHENHFEKIWLMTRDILGNLSELFKMNFALSFRTLAQWESFFHQHNLKIINKKTYFNFIRFTRHAIFVLEKIR